MPSAAGNSAASGKKAVFNPYCESSKVYLKKSIIRVSACLSFLSDIQSTVVNSQEVERVIDQLGYYELQSPNFVGANRVALDNRGMDRAS